MSAHRSLATAALAVTTLLLPATGGRAWAADDVAAAGTEAAPGKTDPAHAAPGAPPIGDAASGQGKAAACGGCHGMDGNSAMGMFPKLAGQVPSQFRKQIADFKSGSRSDPMMTGMAALVGDQDGWDLAAWFASTRPLSAPADPAVAAAGEAIFRWGKPEAGLVACGGCHNRRGEGYDRGLPGGVPAVRGQHPDYTAKQLFAFKDGSRKNDWNGVMRNVASRLSDEEIRSLAAYIGGLQ